MKHSQQPCCDFRAEAFGTDCDLLLAGTPCSVKKQFHYSESSRNCFPLQKSGNVCTRTEKVWLEKPPEGWSSRERWSAATAVKGWMDAMSNVTPSAGQTREQHKALTQSGPKNSQPVTFELILALLKWFVYLKSVSFEPVSQNFQLPFCGPHVDCPLKTELYYISLESKYYNMLFIDDWTSVYKHMLSSILAHSVLCSPVISKQQWLCLEEPLNTPAACRPD